MVFDKIIEKNPDWQLVRLQDVATYVSRGKQPKYVENSEIKTLNQKAIQWNAINYEYLKNHNPEVTVDEKHFIKKGDLVINSTGTGTVGRVFHFDETPEVKMFADSHVTIVRTNENILNSRFLMYQMSSPEYQDMIINGFLAGSTGQVEFNKSKVLELPVLLPPIQTQNQIVQILQLLDKKNEVNKIMIQNLDEIMQVLFKRWFIDFEFPNEQGLPYRSSGGEMVESELGEIPKGWEVSTFSTVMTITSGKRPKNKVEQPDIEHSIPIIGASKIMGFTTDVLYDEPILVIGRVGTHGIVQRLTKQCWASDNTLVLKSAYYNFTYEVLKRIDYVSLNRGSTQPLITQKDIKEHVIVKPPEAILNSFENITNKLLAQIILINDENINLIELRDTLLPKLLSGEIEIPYESVVEPS